MQKLMLQNQLTMMYALSNLIESEPDREELTRQIVETVKAIDDLERPLGSRKPTKENSSVPF